MTHVLVRHRVKSYPEWKPIFDQHRSARKAAGCIHQRVLRGRDNPNDVFVFYRWTDPDEAREFLCSEIFAEMLREAGVVGGAEIVFLDEVEERQLREEPRKFRVA